MPDEEEKSSLNRIGRTDKTTEEEPMKTYSFPRISVDRLFDQGLKPGRDVSLHPLQYNEQGVIFPVLTEGVPDGKGWIAHQTEGEDKEKEDIFLSGFKEGERKGIESEKKRIEPVLLSFHKSLSELARQKEQFLMDAERHVVDLAMAVARKIIGHEVRTNPDTVISIVKEALKKLVDHEGIKVRVSPSDLETIEKAMPQLLEVADEAEKIAFEGDKALVHGGCVVETSLGEIDARVEKQLEAIDEAFRSEREETKSGS